MNIVKKEGFSGLLWILLLLTPMISKADTYGDFNYKTNESGVTITGYSGSGDVVTIPQYIPVAIDTNSSVELPVTSIGDKAFYYMGRTKSITIPDSVTNIGNFAFFSCMGLTNINIPNGVTSIGTNAFFRCTKLTNITIPYGVNFIRSNAFCYCTNLVNITIPESITSIEGGTFCYCSSLTNVTIPNSVTNIGDDAFCNCDSLTTIIIPDSVKNIGRFVFDGDINLTSVVMGNAVTSFGTSMFSYCINLTNITIPNSVVSIGEEAFSSCCRLTSITIPSSVTQIGYFAFSGCTNLVSAYFQGDALSSLPGYPLTSVFYKTADDFSIYYPATASGWSTPKWNGYSAYPYDYQPQTQRPLIGLKQNRGTITPMFSQLKSGISYQLQISSDLSHWTNMGTTFTGTNDAPADLPSFPMTNACLFFRLQAAP